MTRGRGAGPWWKRRSLWIAAATLAIFLGNTGFRRLVGRAWELRRLRQELVRLRAEEATLRESIDASAKAGPALERAARRELGYLKPGEIEYRFPPPGRK